MMNIFKRTPKLKILCGCIAFISGLSSASAAVLFGAGVTGTTAEVTSTSTTAYSGDVSAADLINGLTPTGVTGWFNGRNPDRLVDGLHGAGNSVDNVAQNSGGSPAVAIFDLGTGANGLGYDLSDIVSIAAWGDSGFGNQVWTLEVAGVGSSSYSTLVSVDYQPGQQASRVTLSDISGGLASGVQFVRVSALPNAGGSNNRFVWRQLDVFGNSTAAPIPEPSTTALLGLGGLALILRRRR